MVELKLYYTIGSDWWYIFWNLNLYPLENESWCKLSFDKFQRNKSKFQKIYNQTLPEQYNRTLALPQLLTDMWLYAKIICEYNLKNHLRLDTKSSNQTSYVTSFVLSSFPVFCNDLP